MFYRIVVLNKVKENFQESCEHRWFSSTFSTYISRTGWLLLKAYHEELSNKACYSPKHFLWKALSNY